MHILPVCNNISWQKYSLQNILEKEATFCQKDSSVSELSNYKMNMAFAGLNNISFKNVARPVDITSKYNINEGKTGHLNVPNIHVYEYPDTNLNVFINETPNIKDNNDVYVTLAFTYGGNVKFSPIKSEICRQIINNNLNTYGKINADNSCQGLCTISSKIENKNYKIIENINQIITNPSISVEQLEKAKETLIQEVSNSQSYNHDIPAIIGENNLKSETELIKEIKNINLEDITDYYKNILNHSVATYYITINKNLSDSESARNELLKTLNSGLSVNFQKPDSNSSDIIPILNNNNILYINDDKINGAEIHYPYEGKTYKDYLIADFTNLLLIFLLQPYVDETSDLMSATIPFNVKGNGLSYKYHTIKFSVPKSDFTKLTPERMVNIQKEITKMLCDTDFTVTLNDIKEFYKEIIEENLLKEYNAETNNTLYNLGYDIFNIYELIDSINRNDIINHIDKYMLQQNPVVILGSTEPSGGVQ